MKGAVRCPILVNIVAQDAPSLILVCTNNAVTPIGDIGSFLVIPCPLVCIPVVNIGVEKMDCECTGRRRDTFDGDASSTFYIAPGIFENKCLTIRFIIRAVCCICSCFIIHITTCGAVYGIILRNYVNFTRFADSDIHGIGHDLVPPFPRSLEDISLVVEGIGSPIVVYVNLGRFAWIILVL
jgi:hypothetical protein